MASHWGVLSWAGVGRVSQRRGWLAVGAVIAVAVAGCGTARPAAATGPPTVTVTASGQPRPAPPPRVRGSGFRALWQGAPWADLTIAGGMVLGVAQGSHAAAVHAVVARTGAPVWTATLHGADTQILGLVAAGKAVIAEAGHDVGRAPAAVSPEVFDFIALDMATGVKLWTVPASGRYQSPPVAAAGDVVLTGNPAGVVTARAAGTGTVIWRDRRPAQCRHLSGAPALGLAADGPLVAASFDCGPVVVVQRLDAATGRPLWTWRSPPTAPGASVSLPVAAVARTGGLILLAGEAGPPPAAARFTERLPRLHRWPAALGPPSPVSFMLALSAATGQPRWSELGGEGETFALTGGAVCEIVTSGLECRDDATGAPTLPALVTGQAPQASPPYLFDRDAGVAGGIAAVTLAPLRPGGITVRAVAVHGGATLAQARIAAGTRTYGGGSYQVFTVAAGRLSPHAVLVLVRRVDAPGYPVVALQVPAAQP